MLKKHGIAIVATCSLIMAVIGMVGYLYGLNSFAEIDTPNEHKSVWPSMIFWMSAIFFSIFCLICFINLLLLLPKRLSLLKTAHVFKHINPAFSNHKVVACMFAYMSIIVTFFGFITLLNIEYSYNDKANEFAYYMSEYDKWESNHKYCVKKYKNLTHFLDHKEFNWYKENTIYSKSTGFSTEFKKLYIDSSKKNLEKVIVFTNVFKNLTENFYFSIQTVSTLGYGNITPNTSLGMGLVSTFVLIGQFTSVMVIGVALAKDD
ncbi:potassium channel family protein [Anaeromicropila herbilytica]|uniref:Potassium channel domain-containing protein n=1 Tax=Anaeromicropila herbilytica TaxID=2785025 RepID=A0A7R7EJT5_9FIRM|nr:potassium channel family protein [Anaeromicropila herbilytica]BCN30105.1 hypothetical protein bsdtb5_14000 [Anaeromicropila herbilytica]